MRVEVSPSLPKFLGGSFSDKTWAFGGILEAAKCGDKDDQNSRRAKILGMSPGKASYLIKKDMLFRLAVKAGENICFRCGKPIETSKELSIEHKIPWLGSDDPVGLFFDEDNLAFSHHRCNIGAARKTGRVCFTPEDRDARDYEQKLASAKRTYTPEKRRERYLKYGC